VVNLGPVRIDVPRSIGFYGAIGLAVGAGLIEPPLGVFIAAVPLIKMATNSRAPQPLTWLGQLLDGAAKPVGGDAEGTIRLADPQAAVEQAAQTVALADRASRAARRRARQQAAATTDQPDEPQG
jgi:hypothetical protein